MSEFKTAVLLNDTSVENHFGCDIVRLTLEIKLMQYGIKLTSAFAVDHNWESPGWREKVNSVDIIIVNGEGTLHDDQPRAVRLLEWVETIRSNFTKPLFLINATWFNNSPHLAKKLANFQKIWVRDGESYRQLEPFGLPVEVVGDLTFSGAVSDAVATGALKACQTKGTIITDSVLEKVNLQAIEYSKKFHYVLVSMIRDRHFGQSKTRFLKDKMLRFCYQCKIWCGFKMSVKQIMHVSRVANYAAFCKIIAGADNLIVGRYHGVCLALKNKVPFLAVESNTPKISNLLKDIGIDAGRCVKDMPQEKARIPPFSDEEIRKIDEYICRVDGRIDAMFREICG